ncbi:2-keto-4-pentenoate hydratase [Afifella pfennigii]|uniref:2-keto-4-pentenoate hydratase n=1 Tax=Afifella pfennigii TaxID=209897 RepID=UPI00047E9D14|nr:fumarylacetoacetate hydrolase family protein [Afifella pfennigii]
MSPEDFAAHLAEARASGTMAPVDLDLIVDPGEAERVLAAAGTAYGGRAVGYKIGCTSPLACQIVGAPGPFFAPMVDRDLFQDGAILPWKPQYRGVECEFAFRMARAYPAPGDKVEMEGLRRAVASCHLALEMVGRRTQGEGLPRYPGLVADFGAHCAFVLGPEIRGWADRDLAGVRVTGLLDGEATNEGSGAAVMGGPLNALLWLAEALVERGRRLEEGDYVSTGTTLGVVKAQKGTTVRSVFEDIGEVSLVFAAA